MTNTDLSYPASFTSEPEGGFTVSFPDFPEAHTQGEAFAQAVDCLHTAIEWRLDDKAEIPSPSKSTRGQIQIPVPLDLAPKVGLMQVMRRDRISNVALARKLGVKRSW